MSKLCYENVARSFKVESKDGMIKIQYCIVDTSFDHEFGTKVQFDFELMKVEYWIDEIQDYLELSSDLKELEKIVNDIVEKDLNI